METSLHRQLKEVYADENSEIEVPLGNYRIDVVSDGELVEIQHGSLAAIRDKVRTLLKNHRVLVVKPIVRRKKLVKQDAKGGKVIDRRMSPKCGTILDLFDELVYFTRVFPHRNLSLEAVLVDVEEWRFPGHGRRRRRRERDHQVEDRRLLEVRQVHRFRTARDLTKLLPKRLPDPFHTGHLAERLGMSRTFAQQIAYCLRKMGAANEVGKQGNARLYQFAHKSKNAA